MAPRRRLSRPCCTLLANGPPAAVVEVAQPNYIAYKATAKPPTRASAWVAAEGVPAATAAALADAAVRRAAAADASPSVAAPSGISDGSGSARAVPNDPSYPQAWHLPKIMAPEAWDVTAGSQSVGICVIDTGARFTHQDLAPTIVGRMNRCGRARACAPAVPPAGGGPHLRE